MYGAKGSTFAAVALVLVAAVTAARAEPREIRIASHVSALSPLLAQSRMFAAAVEKRLPGRFAFVLFPDGQLGDERALITSVKAGALEMVSVASGVLKLDAKLELFDLPWLFDDRAHVRRAMEAGLEEAVRRHIEEVAGVKVLGIYENGFRHVLNNRHPVARPADFEGLKIRVSGGRLRQQVFRLMGAAPQSISWKETFTALQTGVVDGVEAAAYGFYEQKQYEIARYLSLTGHVYTPSFLLASMSFWNSLSREQKAALDAAGRAITARAYENAAGLEAKYLDEMAKGLAINRVDLAAFRKATAATYDAYRSKAGDGWLDIVRQAGG